MSTTPGYVSNSDLAQRLSKVVDRWNTRESQMIALLTQETGEVTVTDGLGVNHSLPSFSQLSKNVSSLTNDLTGAVTHVRDMTSAATAMAAAAERSANAAEATADSIRDIEDTTASLRDEATTLRDQARASATASATSASQAASSSAAASNSASGAASSATASNTSRTQAAASATTASSARAAAESAKVASETALTASRTVLANMTDLSDIVEGDAEAASSSAARAGESAAAAASSASTASGHATNAKNSATSASTKASEAAGSASTSANHASSASGSASAAAASATFASTAKAASENARDKAGLFANAPVGTEVAPGEFSARHWANQAHSAATGALVYMGAWDASKGTYPATPVKGHYWRVGQAGAVGSVAYNPGDSIIYNGSTWDKLDNTDEVTSVAGKTGAVELVAGDVGGLGTLATRNTLDFADLTGRPSTYPASSHTHTKSQVGLDKVDNTADLAKPISTATQTALTAKADLSGALFTGKVRVGGPGDGNTLLEFNSDRPWQFKQLGSGANAHLALHDTMGAKQLVLSNVSNSNTIVLAPTTGTIQVNGNAVWHTGSFDPNTKAAAVHSHAITDISGLRASLDGLTPLTSGTAWQESVREISSYRSSNKDFGLPMAFSVGVQLPSPDSAVGIALGAYYGTTQRFFLRARHDMGGTSATNRWKEWVEVWHSANFTPSTKSDIGHAHAIEDVTGLTDALGARLITSGSKLNSDGTPPASFFSDIAPSIAVKYTQNTNGSTGFPTEFGATASIIMGRQNARSFDLHVTTSRSDTLYFRGYTPTSNPSAWRRFAFSDELTTATPSDRELKSNIGDVPRSKVGDFFDAFRVREFDWNYSAISLLYPDFKPTAPREIGAVAQEIENQFPQMIHTDKHSGIKMIHWDKAVPMLIAEVQSLRARVSALESSIH